MGRSPIPRGLGPAGFHGEDAAGAEDRDRAECHVSDSSGPAAATPDLRPSRLSTAKAAPAAWPFSISTLVTARCPSGDHDSGRSTSAEGDPPLRLDGAILHVAPQRTALDALEAESASVLRVGQTVNAIENGKFDPSLPIAFRIARLFDRSIEEIFLDEG